MEIRHRPSFSYSSLRMPLYVPLRGLDVRKCAWIPTRRLRICQTAHVMPCLVPILILHWRLWYTLEFHDSLPPPPPWGWGGRRFISCFVQISFQIFHHWKASLKHLSFQGPGREVSHILPPSSFSFLLSASGVKSCFEGGTVTKGLFYGWKWSEERECFLQRWSRHMRNGIFALSKLELWAFEFHWDETTCLSTGSESTVLYVEQNARKSHPSSQQTKGLMIKSTF